MESNKKKMFLILCSIFAIIIGIGTAYAFTVNRDLNRENITDRFSKENSQARLRNPNGLLTEAERRIMDNVYATAGSTYLGMTPYHFNNRLAFVRMISADGASDVSSHASSVQSVRAVIK